VYDPESARYRYQTLPAINLTVNPAPTTAVADRPAGVLQPVTGLAAWQTSQSTSLYQRAWFWVFLMLPVLALIVGRWRKHYIDRLMDDDHFRRSEFAEKLANERLEKARVKLNDGEDTRELYNQIHKAITGFVSDRLGLPEAGLSDSELLDQIEQNSVNGQTLKSTRYILDKCSTISFAPVGGKDDIESDIRKAEELIKDLKKTI
jgi:hypothetical protein